MLKHPSWLSWTFVSLSAFLTSTCSKRKAEDDQISQRIKFKEKKRLSPVETSITQTSPPASHPKQTARNWCRETGTPPTSADPAHNCADSCVQNVKVTALERNKVWGDAAAACGFRMQSGSARIQICSTVVPSQQWGEQKCFPATERGFCRSGMDSCWIHGQKEGREGLNYVKIPDQRSERPQAPGSVCLHVFGIMIKIQ